MYLQEPPRGDGASSSVNFLLHQAVSLSKKKERIIQFVVLLMKPVWAKRPVFSSFFCSFLLVLLLVLLPT